MANSSGSFFCSVRFLCAIVIFFGYCFNYMQKIDMGIAIVCMTNHTAVKLAQNNSITSAAAYNASLQASLNEDCPASATKKTSSDGTFVWSKKIQGLILSAYFYGYIFTQIPGGYLSFKFGGRMVLGLSLFLGSIITCLIPFFARWNYIALIVCLFVKGATHGAFWPGVSSFWAYWAPNSEKTRLVGMSSSGARVGNVFSLAVGGFLCVYGLDGGWPSIFYSFGLLGVTWFIFFIFLTADGPQKHKFISEKEKNFILHETRKNIETREYCQSSVPWGRILASKACWSIFIGHFTHNWGNYLFMTQIPSYLRDVLKFDLKSNGLVASLPYIVCWVFINMSSIISDKLISQKIKKSTVRRLFVAIGTLLPAGFIIALSFINCRSVYIGVALLIMGIACDAIVTGAGYLVNVNDVAGPYSGIVFGISNTIATVPGLISPLIASVLTTNQTQKEWQLVFIICSVVYVVGGLLAILLLEDEIQPWAVISKKSPEESDKFIENHELLSNQK